MAEDRLLTTTEAAEFLGVTERLLNEWRYRGEGPPYTKLGHRTIRYSRADLDAWIKARRVVAS